MNEMTKLILVLNTLGITHTIEYQRWYNNAIQIILSDTLDVICNKDSLGGREGLLEIWDQTSSDAIGYLTAKDVLAYILKNN